MKYHLFLILLLLAGCKGCDETATPENKKPEPTTDGRNTFYCEINGKPYYQKFVGGQPSYPTITGSYSNSPDIEGMNFTITYPNGNNSEYINFTGISIFSKGTFIISSVDKKMLRYFKNNSCDYMSSYHYNSMSGKIIFTRYDMNKGIFSGTFEFKNWLPDSIRGSCDTVKITNGIFDLML